MKILFTGKGSAGSWQMRGIQLGKASGANVIARASRADCKKSNVIVAVKRIGPVLDTIRQSKKPWIWDLVDFYPQPECAAWSREKAIAWVRKQIECTRPTGIVWPNERMRADCDPGLSGIVVPHHYDPSVEVNPIRDKIRVVGYQGAEKYLGCWRDLIETECRRRGWIFKDNVPLHEMDIVVAFRLGEFNGYAQRHWKSNVKLTNAHGSGTPFVGPRECSYLEMAAGCEQWVDQPVELRTAFEMLDSPQTRLQIQKSFLAKAYPVSAAAERLKTFLQEFV